MIFMDFIYSTNLFVFNKLQTFSFRESFLNAMFGGKGSQNEGPVRFTRPPSRGVRFGSSSAQSFVVANA